MLADLNPGLVIILSVVIGFLLAGGLAGGIATIFFQIDREKSLAPVLAEERAQRIAAKPVREEQPRQMSTLTQAVMEGGRPEMESNIGVNNDKLGMWAFLTTEIMIFSALIASFIAFDAGGRIVYPEIDMWIPIAGTFILIASSVTVVFALDALQHGRTELFITLIIASLVLAIGFVAGIQRQEWLELIHKGIVPGVEGEYALYATFFFVMTGFHGLHVIGGIGWMLVALFRALRGDYTHEHYIGFENFGLYWHFVDVVWIVLFTVIYLTT